MTTTVFAKCVSFKRELRVNLVHHSLYQLNSNTYIPDCIACAKLCKNEECLSFMYTEVDQTCNTYSKQFVQDQNTAVSTSQMFFSKVYLDHCSDIDRGHASGVYQITAQGQNVPVYCDMETEDGPWIVIQKRTAGDVDFYRNWSEYKNGFGDLHGEFWIGNDNLHILTTTPRILRVELEAWEGDTGYAQYSTFQVADESQNYRLLVQGFSGNVSYDAMSPHSGAAFSTYDRDNDQYDTNCAKGCHGAWWYTECFESSLNGGHIQYDGHEDWKGIIWWFFPVPDKYNHPIKKTKLMIR
ncbi:microfibril-associated glycoprotein 4-like [Argopecten irradians]|uniref:microfibril-associated glycoprotein 4-like n=1 Tax=Argopecten irradians TaxID=31199 RepID=UPI003721F773